MVLYGSRQKSYVLMRLKRGETTACAFGSFPHELFIGKPFGSRVVSPVKQGCVRRDGQNGWVWALRLTSELWSRFLPHRTQVLYSADIAMIVFHLGIVPGCIAVESGTGSGSLTFALAKAAGPTGRVYTYDFHQLRADEARRTFSELGMDNVVVSQADACNDGFLHPADGADLHGRVDGVFLDLPSPWDAVKHADAVLKPGGMFCSFSPCIEQVQRTCLELVADSKFHSLCFLNCSISFVLPSHVVVCLLFTVVRTIECLEREFDLKRNPLPDAASNILEECRPPSKRGRSEAENAPDADESPASSSAKTPAQFMVKPVAETRGHTGFLTFACKTVKPTTVEPPVPSASSSPAPASDAPPSDVPSSDAQ